MIRRPPRSTLFPYTTLFRSIAISGAAMFPGVYTFDAFSIEIKGVFTNLTPTDAYRGAGRPEAAYAIERAIDALARKLDMDPVEVRRKNFYEPFDEPTERSEERRVGKEC